FYPQNALLILKVLAREQDPLLAEKMIITAETYLSDNSAYRQRVSEYKEDVISGRGARQDTNLFLWVNTIEWKTLQAALRKDAAMLDSVADKTHLSARLLAAMLIGEQIRLFDSKREAFKKWISPLKILVNETKISLGVMGIKEETAIKIEKYLKDRQSLYYLGPEYEKMLDFQTDNIENERYQRLTDPGNHHFPYLYAALFLRQVEQQWKRSGYDITGRPEILATLFNLGFEVSVPKSDPRVGGSRIMIQNREYTFGALAWEFYYSGELEDVFPYTRKPGS
ncbi:MAG: hypothetical protein NTU44_10975, partial [Bacteroidetes bacterium]|nr:hypothetical protein [Bacteroidota bacterium]